MKASGRKAICRPSATRTAQLGGRNKGDRQFVTALARGLDILNCFSRSRPEIGGTQLAAMTGLPQPTVWRLCHTMIQLGYLVPVSGGKLRPGIPTLRVGRATLATMPLARDARDRMQSLADRFGSACALGARDGSRIVLVQSCLSEAQLLMNLCVGARRPLTTSAQGWALLAGLAEKERNALIDEYGRPDPRWASVEPMFWHAMEEYSAHGFILNMGVFHPDYNTAATPIMGPAGGPAFALSCAGSAVTHTASFLRKEVAPELLKLAGSLEAELLQLGGDRRRDGRNV